MDWDWNGIRHFAALVEKQTLTAAAEYLGVQHSTVSRQIAQLEHTLGLRLFDRIGKRYLLTEDGARLHRHAEELCKNMAVLRRVAREQAEMRHSVTVSAPPLVARILLMPHLPAFRRTHPNIRLHLHSEAAQANLHRRQADIALRLVRPTQNDLTIRRLRGFHYQIYGHQGYLKSTARDRYQFIRMETATPHSRWFAEQIGTAADTVFACNDFDTAKQAIISRIGIGLLPDFAVSPADGLQALALSADTPPGLAAEICLVMHEDVRRSPAVRAAADFIGAALAS